MATNATLSPPTSDPTPAPPEGPRLVTPELLYLNQGTTYKLGASFAGTANPSVVWQQMIDNMPMAMMYYRELEAKDDDICDAIAEVKLSVLKRDWTVQPGDESPLADQAAIFIREQFNSLPDFRNVLNNLLDAPFYGYTVAELMFDTSMGQASLQDITDCPQELFCFNPFFYPQVGALRLKTVASSPDGNLVDETKFLVFTSRSRHGNRMGSAILREVYWSSWFKRQVQRFWLRYGEKGPGTAVVTYAAGATADDRQIAVQAAQALVDQVAIAVPENFKVITELLQGTRSMDPATYEKLYSTLESKLYRRIVGGTLTSHGSDGGKGTQALGNVHQETKEERSVELCLQVAAVIQRQLVSRLTLWNFGPDCPVPTFSFDIADEADLGQDVTTADTLQSMGLSLPKKWAYEHFGIPQPEEGEETLDRPAPPPPIAPIATPAGTPVRPLFSSAQQRQIDQDKADVDVIFDELRNASLQTTARQITEITKGIELSHLGGHAQ